MGLDIITKIKDHLIADGIKSVEKYEKRPERKRGALTGFGLCRLLNTPEDFQSTLAERHRTENHMAREGVSPEVYWEYRMATAQVEFLWEHLRILWGIGDLFSGNAYMRLRKILTQEAEGPRRGLLKW